VQQSHFPTITALSDGRFVVSWSGGGDSTAQVFNANGSKAGAEFLVNTTTQGSQAGSAITALIGGTIALLAAVTRQLSPMTRCWTGLTANSAGSATEAIISAPRTATLTLTGSRASRPTSAPYAI